MTPCAAAIAIAINALPGASSEHVTTTAEAISIVAPTPRRASLLVAIGYSESRFLPRIQAGDCKSYKVRGQMQHECDAEKQKDGTLLFTSLSYFQMKRTSLVPEWPNIIGLDLEDVTRATRAADRILARGMRMCKTDAGAASYYALGHCRWPGGQKRALLAEKIRNKLSACRNGDEK